jgi:hypothetical protein
MHGHSTPHCHFALTRELSTTVSLTVHYLDCDCDCANSRVPHTAAPMWATKTHANGEF